MSESPQYFLTPEITSYTRIYTASLHPPLSVTNFRCGINLDYNALPDVKSFKPLKENNVRFQKQKELGVLIAKILSPPRKLAKLAIFFCVSSMKRYVHRSNYLSKKREFNQKKDSRQGSSMHVHAISTTTVLLDGAKYVHVKNWSINVGLQNWASHQDWIVNLQIWQWKIRPKNPKRHIRHAKTYRILLSKAKEIIVSRVEISFGRCRG